MFELSFGLIYWLGLLWFWRYHVGYLMDYIGYDLDESDLIMGVFLGSVINFAWPLTVSGRAVYVTHQKFFAGTLPSPRIFPGPKPIETREDRIRRQQQEERERQQEESRRIRMRQAEINKMESENGLPVTDWSNT